MRLPRNLLAVALGAALLPVAAAAPAHAAADPAFEITEVQATGTGCPKDSPARAEVRDGRVVVSPGKGMSALAGTRENGVYVARAVRACQVGMKLVHAAGWQVSVPRLDADGRAMLAGGAAGQFVARARPAGDVGGPEVEARMAGPTWGGWGIGGTAPGRWSECGAAHQLLVDAQVVAAVETADRETQNVVRVNGDAGLRLDLAWRQCPSAPRG
ncbi:hypothetical protein GCM10010124_30310 [Pilimelia terevasa]|uniref:DUF4360 domain-containing protein n=1 Tax=Pilimelia terevasa TaxID=53372 RepID=A0A8J3BSC1_9ACTN|nr:DUF4360 domain-containing protein [Pilimelia terevasa]GGK35554.1 hypothetical protein GCM10010124_30310 [Pilimelia terevasa]